MWQQLRRVIAPPVFDGDEDKTHAAQILNAIIWFIILIFALILIGMPFVPQALLGTVIVGGLLAIAVGALAVLHAGYVKLVSWGVVLVLWSTAAFFVALSGGLSTPETAGFVIVLVVAGMLLGVRPLLTFAGLSLLASVVITWLDIRDMLLVLFPITPSTALMISVANILISAGLFSVTLSGWRQALSRAQKYAQAVELERANLEQRVLERTQAINVAHQEAEAARLEAESDRQALEIQVWQTVGLVDLSEALRGEQTLVSFCQNAIQSLCIHMQVPVGALYLVAKGDLVFGGGYAFVPEDEQACIAIGEGLLGQAALEGRPIRVENVPPDYLRLISGLGQAQPAQLMIWPLQYNQQLIGVIELGMLAAITNEQEKFLERAGEFIAITLQTTQARQQINELLHETQAQAEELQTREEELRAINDKLQAQAEHPEARR